MDRQARVNFRVIRINRWSLALALLVALGLLLFPLGRLLPVSGPAPARVKPRVSLLGRDLGGLAEAQVRAAVAEMAAQAGLPPVDARRLEAGGDARLLPDLDGFALDTEQTVFRVMTAPAGMPVAPVWRSVPARVTAGQFTDLPIYSANPGKRAVALLINVAWGTEHLPDMLASLKRHHARATFMLTGRWARQNPLLVRSILADGHEVGNHGYDANKDPQDMLRAGTLRADIQQADELIRAVTGRKPVYYQPHKGDLDKKGEIVRIARELGYTTVMWSRDTIDWREDATVSKVAERAAAAGPGDIILMHPTEPSRRALDTILRKLADRQLATMTLSEILASSHTPATAPVLAPPATP